MELEDLKSGWQEAGGTYKAEAELQKMTKESNHPTLKKIRIRLIFEMILMSLFLLIYYSGFDGDKKSFIVNLLLVISVILVILNDVIGYVSISKKVEGTNLRINIQLYLTKIKRLSVLSIFFSFLYSISLMLFFSTSINFNMKKYFIMAAIIVILLLSVFFSYRIWATRIRNLKNLSLEMEEEA